SEAAGQIPAVISPREGGTESSLSKYRSKRERKESQPGFPGWLYRFRVPIRRPATEAAALGCPHKRNTRSPHTNMRITCPHSALCRCDNSETAAASPPAVGRGGSPFFLWYVSAV